MTIRGLVTLIISLLLVCGAAVFMIFELYVTIIGHLKGAPFVKSGKKKVATMLALAGIMPGEKVVDLGSGDGTLLIEAAKLGASATGIEINPFLVQISKWRAKRAGVSDKVTIFRGNFWNYPLNDTRVVFVYLWPETLERLEKKFREELGAGSRIISNNFPLKNWRPVKEEAHVFLYEMGKSEKKQSVENNFSL